MISLDGVKSKDFDAFLSVLYPLCVFYIRISRSHVIDDHAFAQEFQRIGRTLVRRVVIHLGLIYSVGFHHHSRIGHPLLEAAQSPPTTRLGAEICC